MPIPSKQDVAAKWKSRASAAGNDWVDGIDKMTENPAAKAVARSNLWQQRVSSPDALAKYERNLGLVTLNDIKNAVKAKGPSRYTSGINASTTKYEQRMGEVLDHIRQGQNIIDQPVVDLDSAVNKAGEWIRHMANFQRSA